MKSKYTTGDEDYSCPSPPPPVGHEDHISPAGRGADSDSDGDDQGATAADREEEQLDDSDDDDDDEAVKATQVYEATQEKVPVPEKGDEEGDAEEEDEDRGEIGRHPVSLSIVPQFSGGKKHEIPADSEQGSKSILAAALEAQPTSSVVQQVGTGMVTEADKRLYLMWKQTFSIVQGEMLKNGGECLLSKGEVRERVQHCGFALEVLHSKQVCPTSQPIYFL